MNTDNMALIQGAAFFFFFFFSNFIPQGFLKYVLLFTYITKVPRQLPQIHYGR